MSNAIKYKKSNHLHTVENVVQSTFQNMSTTFLHKPYNPYFEFSSKRILTKNPYLIFFFWGGVGQGGIQGQGIKETGGRGRQNDNFHE